MNILHSPRVYSFKNGARWKRSGALWFSTGQWPQSSEKYDTHLTIQYIYSMQQGHGQAPLWLTLGDGFTRAHAHIQNPRQVFSDSLFHFFSRPLPSLLRWNEWMSDPERPLKSSTGTVSARTISQLRGRPQLRTTSVFVLWNLAWQLPVPDSQTGCQHKLWSVGQVRREGGNSGDAERN